MVTVKLLKNYLQHEAGDIVALDNNIAHGLIETGAAKVVAPHYENRMAGGQNRHSEPRVK